MNPEEKQPPSAPTSQPPPPPMPASTQPPFDPSRMIGLIKRKALIKELAAVYHAECLAYCQEILELQKKWEEPLLDIKFPNDLRKETTRKETMRPPKRVKKTRK